MSGIYSDPRYEALGLTDTTQARAADQFYGSIQPPEMMNVYGGNMGAGGFQDEDDLQVAYEKDIIGRMSQLDPTRPDYDFQLQGFIASQDDPNIISYPRVRTAAQALLGRSQFLRQNAQKTLQEEQTLRTQLAENGYDPAKFSEITRPDGRLDRDRAYFQLGELKRTNGASGKVDPLALRPAESEKLMEVILPLNTPPTVQEKITNWQLETGNTRNPENAEEWTAAHYSVENPRKQQAQGVIRSLQALGRRIPDEILRQAGMQTSVVPSTQASQSLPPSTAPTSPQAPAIPPTNPSSPNISMAEAAAAARGETAAIQSETAQQEINNQWNAAKGELEGQLLQQFQGDRNRLQQFYRSVISDETAGEGEEEVSYAPDEYDPTLQLPVAERTLRQAGIDPSAPVSQIPNRGFFSGGAVDKNELLRALAQERVSTPASASAEAPLITDPSQLSAIPIGGLFRTMQNGKLVTVRREK